MGVIKGILGVRWYRLLRKQGDLHFAHVLLGSPTVPLVQANFQIGFWLQVYVFSKIRWPPCCFGCSLAVQCQCSVSFDMTGLMGPCKARYCMGCHLGHMMLP